MPIHENMTENRKVAELKKDSLYWCVSFVVHRSNIQKGWMDVCFLQRLNHSKWVVIPVFFPKGLAQNVKMDHNMKFHRSLQTMQLMPMFTCKYICKAVIESIKVCTIFLNAFGFGGS